jgi:hypothetical protein
MNGDYEDVLLRLLAGAGDLVVLESPEARDQIRRELESKNPNTGLFREFATAEVHLNVPSASAGEADVGPQSQVAPRADDPTAPEPAPDASQVEEEIAAVSPEPVEATASADIEAVEATAASGNGESNGTYFDFETTALDPVELAPAGPATVEADTKEAETAASVAASPDEQTEGDSSEPSPTAGIWKPGHPTKETVTRMSQDDCGWCGDSLPDRPDVNFCPFCGKTTTLKPCPGCGDEMDLQWRFCVRCGTEATVGAAAAGT